MLPRRRNSRNEGYHGVSRIPGRAFLEVPLCRWSAAPFLCASDGEIPTGRPGPAGWELGSYPAERAESPVSGVGWYEAAAYAEFADKQLPTVFHWWRAAVDPFASEILPVSNFDGKEVAAVGKYQGVSPFGNYDLAGNVKEWCWNQTGDRRNALGGAWNEPSYTFLSARCPVGPFERSETIQPRIKLCTWPGGQVGLLRLG